MTLKGGGRRKEKDAKNLLSYILFFIVSIHLPQDMYITLSVYNSSGVLVKKILENQLKSKGVHYYMHNATNLPNGLYTYVVKGCEEQDYDSGIKY